MAGRTKGPLDNSYRPFIVKDFSGGIVTNTGSLDLAPNQALQLLNLIPFPGKLMYRGGWTTFSTLAAAADRIWGFYDSNGAKHLAVWAGGSVYDVISGTPVLIDSAAYTAGAKIGVADSNGILYWSTTAVPIRFWNPVLGTHGAVAQTGSSAVPKAQWLTIYAGSLVALNINFGSSPQPNVFTWSAVNDFGNWTAANSQAVGPNNGIGIAFGQPFGISEIGVAPFRTLIVGRYDQGIYAYQGALGSLTENLLNCPVGVLDGESVQYIPSLDAFGTLIFLGTDAQIWATNGITVKPISTNILPTLSAAVIGAQQASANPRFIAGYNEKWQYYFVNISGQQFVYKWDTNAWAIFSGWPAGHVEVFPNSNGVPTIYVASMTTPFLVAQVGISQANDNGTPPTMIYQSPYFDLGDPELLKSWDWVSMFSYNTGTNYKLMAQTMPRPDGSFMTSNPLIFNGVATGGSGIFKLDSSLLDGPDVLAGPTVMAVGTGVPMINHGRFSSISTPTGILEGMAPTPDSLRGGAVSITITYNGGVTDFELVGLELRSRSVGYLRDGGAKYNPEGGILTPSPYLIGTNT